MRNLTLNQGIHERQRIGVNIASLDCSLSQYHVYFLPHLLILVTRRIYV